MKTARQEEANELLLEKHEKIQKDIHK